MLLLSYYFLLSTVARYFDEDLQRCVNICVGEAIQRQFTRDGTATWAKSPAGGSTGGPVGTESRERGATKDVSQHESTQPAGGHGPARAAAGDL